MFNNYFNTVVISSQLLPSIKWIAFSLLIFMLGMGRSYSTGISQADKNELKLSLNKIQKEYQKKLDNMEKTFFKVLIVDHPIIKNKKLYLTKDREKEVENSVEQIKKSMKKVREFKQYQLNLFHSTDKQALEKVIKKNLIILQDLFPLAQKYKKELDYLEELTRPLLEKSKDQHPILQAIWEKKVIVRSLKGLLNLYSEDLMKAIEILDNNSYKGNLVDFFKFSKDFLEEDAHQDIKKEIDIYKKLLMIFPSCINVVEEAIKEYDLVAPSIRATIGKLSLPSSLTDYINTQKSSYASGKKITTLDSNIEGDIDEINKSIKTIQNLTQSSSTIYSEALDQLTNAQEINKAIVEVEIKKYAHQLKKLHDEYLQPIQVGFEQEVIFLTQQRETLSNSTILEKETTNQWKEQVWEKESRLIKNLLTEYSKILQEVSNFIQSLYSPPSLSNYNSKLKGIHQIIIQEFISLKIQGEKSQTLEVMVIEAKKHYQKEAVRMQKNIEKLRIPKTTLREINRIATTHTRGTNDHDSIQNVLKKINNSIDDIAENIQKEEKKYDNYLVAPQKTMDDLNKRVFIDKVKKPWKNLKNKQNHYLLPIQKKFEEVVTTLAGEFKKLPKSDHFSEDMKRKWDSVVVQIKSQLLQALDIYADGLTSSSRYDFSTPPVNRYLSYQDYTDKVKGKKGVIQELEKIGKAIPKFQELVSSGQKLEHEQEGDANNNSSTAAITPQELSDSSIIGSSALTNTTPILENSRTTTSQAKHATPGDNGTQYPDKYKLPLIILIGIVVMLGIGRGLVYFIIGFKKRLMLKSPKELS